MADESGTKAPQRGATQPELRTYWVTACVELHTEIPPDPTDPDDQDPLVGYVRNFGVTSASEVEARDLVTSDVTDGDITWSQSAITADMVGRLTPIIVTKSGDWTERGIWYRSGRMLFPPS